MFAAGRPAGGRQSDSDTYTLTSTDLDLLQKWAPRRWRMERRWHYRHSSDAIGGLADR